MDPFTEKLLERTRARRENLQKKMADRPTPTGRQMAKRAREPLVEANGASDSTAATAPPVAKPSPSKRRCSSENDQPVAMAENRELPVGVTTEPLTDRKPPTRPVATRPVPAPARPDPAPMAARPVPAPVPAPTSPRPAHIPAHPDPAPMAARPVPAPVPAPTSARPAHIPNPAPARPDPAPTAARPVPAPVHASARPAPIPDPAPTPEPDRSTDRSADANAGPAPPNMRSRLQRLAEQRQHWDTDALSDSPAAPPSQRWEAVAAPVSTETPVGRRGRLAHLVATIGSWEDDLARPAQWGDNAQVQPGTACVPPPARPTAKPGPGNNPGPGNKPVLSTQQTPQSPVRSAKAGLPEARCAPQVGLGVSSSPQKSHMSSGPAALHSGKALSASPQKAGPSQTPPKTQVAARQFDSGPHAPPSPSKPGLLAKSVATATATPLLPKGAAGTPAPGGAGVKSFLERFGERCQERSAKGSPPPAAATPSLTPNTRPVQDRLRNVQGVTATADLAQKQKLERENELAQIRNRFQKGNVWKDAGPKVQPPAENRAMESRPDEVPTAPPVDATSTAPQPKPADAPCSLEKAEVASEKRSGGSSDEDEGAREVHAVVREVEMNVDESNSSEVINQLFEEALEESEEEEEQGDEDEDPLNISSMSLLIPLAETVSTVVKSPEMKLTSTPAGSFCDKDHTPEGVSRLSRFQRLRPPRADEEGAADDDQNLPYSIDAYRSIRVKETERPRIHQAIVRKEDVSQRGEEPARSNHVSVKQRLKVLTNEMNLQQTVIHQASQALNCCTDEDHGKGSQVEAEAERLLLIATERRCALKAELDRLKGEGPAGQKKGPAPSRAQDDLGIPASKGSVSLNELRLPLKADFVCAAANRPETANYYFFVMIRAGAENTVATPLASTRNALSGDALTFSTKFTLPDVSNDFEIDVEVYCLVQKRDLHSDKKKKSSKSKILWRHVHQVHEACFSAITPKRLLTSITKSGLQTPVMASPGGPNAVRTSNFALVGSHTLTLASIGKNKFPLEKIRIEGMERQLLGDLFQFKVPFLCPLEGHVYLRLQCEVGSRLEERGFLTMFEDVSGFGAWHRRWCVLSGYCVSYWTYPDDEKRKIPIGRINLANCTSRRVEPANREFCARPNTMELVTVRPQREDDKETLVSRCKNTMCVTKNWLSADTKDERNLWMHKLNQILVDLRMWQPEACYRPL